MLETLRAFGLDRLDAHDERRSAAACFRRWAESFVLWVDRTIVTAEEPLANRRLLAELGNLRTVWHLAQSSDDLDLDGDPRRLAPLVRVDTRSRRDLELVRRARR